MFFVFVVVFVFFFCCFCFFFFQAEDGIRDIGVTGVQTCALPILVCSTRPSSTVCVPVFPEQLPIGFDS